ncbi:MAG: hypothetical protein HY815_09455 [Candidatus Riflebacteria bacterium]|nr:hypothetical protein [Candidatus Riflebacteria bacterium]
MKDWAENGWLQRLDFDRADILKLLEAVQRDLDTARLPGLHPDCFKVLDSLRFTLEIDSKCSRKLDLCRKKRNAGVYEQVGAVSEEEAAEMVEIAASLRVALLDWLRIRHPDLHPGS